MRKNNVIWLFASILIVISLVACGNEENPSKSSKDSNSKSNSVENSTTSTEKPKSKTSDDNNQVEDKDKKETEEDVYTASSDKKSDPQTSGNLLNKNKVFKYKDGSVVMTLTKAEFTKNSDHRMLVRKMTRRTVKQRVIRKLISI